jgi:hypothetical protein
VELGAGVAFLVGMDPNSAGGSAKINHARPASMAEKPRTSRKIVRVASAPFEYKRA